MLRSGREPEVRWAGAEEEEGVGVEVEVGVGVGVEVGVGVGVGVGVEVEVEVEVEVAVEAGVGVGVGVAGASAAAAAVVSPPWSAPLAAAGVPRPFITCHDPSSATTTATAATAARAPAFDGGGALACNSSDDAEIESGFCVPGLAGFDRDSRGARSSPSRPPSPTRRGIVGADGGGC